jgi:hypothetical protein
MKIKFITQITSLAILMLFLLYSHKLQSQFYFQLGTGVNYWEHTDLYGGIVNIGTEYKHQRLRVRANLGVGYGKTNRFKEYPNVRFNDKTLLVNIAPGLNFNDVSVNSDYSFQEDYSISLGLQVLKINKFSFESFVGLMYSDVRHHLILGYDEWKEVDHISKYRGGFFEISQQRFQTLTTVFELNCTYALPKSKITFYTNAGFGPNYTDFRGVGIRVSGAI